MKTLNSNFTKSQTQKSRDCAPASCIAVQNTLEPIMPTDIRMYKRLVILIKEGK